MPNDHRLELLAKISPDAVRWMLRVQPTHRAACRVGVRPCPHLLCRFHTYLRALPEEKESSSQESQLALQQPNREFWEQPTCQLDILEQEALEQGAPIEADQPVGPHTLLRHALEILSPKSKA